MEKQIAQREKQLELNTRSVREDTARMQRIREEEYERKQRRKSVRIRLALCLPLCAVLAALAIGVAAPVLRRLSAERAMQEKRWEDAAQSLELLGSFPGAEQRLEECRWHEAEEQADRAETADELLDAAAALRAVAGYTEAETRAQELDLRRARIALEEKDTLAAREAVENLPAEDERRIALENECLFMEAKSQMALGQYEDARAAFLQLGTAFPEAASLAADCIWMPASELMGEGRYEEAIAELSRIPDHPKSRAAVLECHYRLAQAAEENEDLETAAAEYLMAVGYEDAEAKMQQAVFTLAEQHYEAGEMEEARKLYASIPGYEPAAERERETTLLAAREALDKRDYELAAELLDTLPDGYGDSAELIPRAAYLAGSDAYRKKDWEKAAAFLEQAGDYRDAPSMLEKALESLVKARLDSGDGAGALELLPRVTHSKNYKEYKQEAEYLDAMAQVSLGGDPAKLQKRFEALGNYRDAADRVKQMVYLQAEEAESRQEILTAAKLFEKAAGWKDAKERAAELYDRYYGDLAASVQEAMEAEDYPLAVTLLETIDRTGLPEKYAGLEDDFETACIRAGEQLYQAGRPYEAAAYFRLADNERKTRRWLSAACYRIIGRWADRKGNFVAEFREDSTCEIAGESFTFLVSDSFTLKTETDGKMEASFRITSLTDDRLSLRDMREGHTETYELFREKAGGAAPEGAEEPEEPDAGEDDAEGSGFSVSDGDE